ncbi:hypothetical protein CBM2599_A120524 [Cupriavidus taiwanensis]|uniref:hypothetical protein n=1 Tax=Cupriavidus taiwanensis TaxID=164546 RepID=UPI000E1937D0|nr:hypothetical protein [Cupriavidus taiwanensis]SOY79959.1 hypothetical protein CBM2599_A120524 [Cupriavidus taiwanensis]SOY81928.1 hypothetical protein CBM2600_A120546 [Cupriavidus taiwanensis]
MNAPIPAKSAQIAWINELLHRMTVAQTVEVRMQLCAELKREIAACLGQQGGK